MDKEHEHHEAVELPLKKILKSRVTWEVAAVIGLIGGITAGEALWRRKQRLRKDHSLHPALEALTEFEDSNFDDPDMGRDSMASFLNENRHLVPNNIDSLFRTIGAEIDIDHENPVAEIMKNVRIEKRKMSPPELVHEIANAIVLSTEDEEKVVDRHKLFQLLRPTMKLRRSLKNQNIKILDLADVQVAGLVDEIAGEPQKLDKKTIDEVRNFFGATQGTLDEIIHEVIDIVRNKESTRFF